jgi:hypothetical protein
MGRIKTNKGRRTKLSGLRTLIIIPESNFVNVGKN